MRTTILVVLCLVLPAAAVPADAQFAARVHREGDKALPYRLLIPRGYAPGEARPLVVWLHGSGEVGTDNAAQMKSLPGTFLASAECPAFVMVPQCPPNTSWSATGINKAPEITETARMVVATIAELRQEFKLDDRRTYVGGFSMGAYGTWELIGRYPNLFAAAFPISGSQAKRVALAPFIKDIPIWVFHGDRDANVPVEGSRALVAALKAAGSPVRYTEYPGMVHQCGKALAEPQLPEWLFAQKRSAAASLTPIELPAEATIIVTTLPDGTHGTWTATVGRTVHAVPRIAIEGMPYRMRPAANAGPAVAAFLDRIGKGEVTGQCRVTGTVELDERIWLAVEEIEPAAGQ